MPFGFYPATAPLQSYTTARSFGRPGLQLGAVVALADQNLRSTTESISDYGLKMATISEAEAGQGQTVSGSRAVGGLSIGSMVSDARSKANSGRW